MFIARKTSVTYLLQFCVLFNKKSCKSWLKTIAEVSAAEDPILRLETKKSHFLYRKQLFFEVHPPGRFSNHFMDDLKMLADIDSESKD